VTGLSSRIKATLADVPGAWAREWKDGSCWVGPNCASAIEALSASGFNHKTIDVPGTSFKTCIEVIE
jgi:hypothetical protein